MIEHIGFCEVCMKNAHQEVKMIKRVVASDEEHQQREMLCCPVCGSIRSL